MNQSNLRRVLAGFGILAIASAAWAAMTWTPNGGSPGTPGAGTYTGVVTTIPGVWVITTSSGQLDITQNDASLSVGESQALARAEWEADANNTVTIVMNGPTPEVSTVTCNSPGTVTGYVEYCSGDANDQAYYWIRDSGGTVLALIRDDDPSLSGGEIASLDTAVVEADGDNDVTFTDMGEVASVTP